MNSNEVPVNPVCSGSVVVGARRSGRTPTASDCAIEYEVSSSTNGSAISDWTGQPARADISRTRPCSYSTSQRRYKLCASDQYAATGSAGGGNAKIERAPRRYLNRPTGKDWSRWQP